MSKKELYKTFPHLRKPLWKKAIEVVEVIICYPFVAYFFWRCK